MRTMTKIGALSVVAMGLSLGLSGCAEDNEKAVMAGNKGAGGGGGEGKTPPGAPAGVGGSEKFKNQNAGNSPMEKAAASGNYKQQN